MKGKGAAARGGRVRGAGRQRINSEPVSSRFEHGHSPPPGGASEQVPPEMMGVVTHLTFADTYVSGELNFLLVQMFALQHPLCSLQ